MIAPEKWKPAAGLTLEPNAQRAATARVRNLALTAGPGAGKSEMLAQRADFLLRTGVCPYPRRILAISFKTDASRNLKARVALRCGESMASRFDSYTFHGFAKRIIDKFRVVLVGANELDRDYTIGDVRVQNKQITFDDMLPLALEIVNSCPTALRSIRHAYSDVFLDEFQDCNLSQYKLIKKIFRGTNIRLTSVGDTKQKIMGFAGALEGIFQTFATDFNAVPLNLYRNFRSEPRLLQMQNKIIARMDPDSVMDDEVIAGAEGEVQLLEFESAIDEANEVATIVAAWITDENIPAWDIAIIISRQINLYGGALMTALQERGVPFRNEHDQQEDMSNPLVEIFIDYLRILAGEGHPGSYLRIKRFVESDYHTEWAGKQANDRWESFFRKERSSYRKNPAENEPAAWDYIKRFAKHVGMAKLNEYCSDSGYNLRESAKRSRGMVKKAFDSDKPLDIALAGLSQSDSVKILTVHKSKGLEYHSVVFLAIENETFFGNITNERCNFFVGISRAKKRLVLTTSEYRPRPAGHGGMWREHRSGHEEFLAYAEAD